MEGRRDLRVERTYYMLHNAFTELLEQKPFESITVNEICDRAMIRRTTFYKHFADKFEYLRHYFSEIQQEIQNQLEPDIMLKEPSVYFADMSRELFHFMAAHEKLVKNIRKSNMFAMFCDILSEQIQNDLLSMLRAIGVGPAQLNEPEAAAAFYAGGLVTSLRWYITNRSMAEENQFAAFVEDMVRGWKLDQLSPRCEG